MTKENWWKLTHTLMAILIFVGCAYWIWGPPMNTTVKICFTVFVFIDMLQCIFNYKPFKDE